MNWEEAIFGKQTAPEAPEGFPHVVHLQDALGGTPGARQSEKLRFALFFAKNGLEAHRDFTHENWVKDKVYMTSFYFRDPQIAMLFKLSFLERG